MRNTFIAFILALCLLPLAGQETHRVAANETLYSLSRLYGVSVDELKVLNQLSGSQIRIGQVLVIRKEPAAPVDNSRLEMRLDTHKIKYGDSLSNLAVRYSTSLEELRRINGLKNDNLQIGQIIFIRQPKDMIFHTVIPGDTLSGLSYRFDISQNDLRQMNNLSNTGLSIGQRLRVVKPKTPPLRHEVQEMDSLESVAFLYDKEPEELRRLNGLADNDIQRGQTLLITPHAVASARIPQAAQDNELTSAGRETADSTQERRANAEELTKISHRVESGDTLYGLSRTYGVRADEIKNWNNLGSSIIRIGQELVLYTSKPKEIGPQEEVENLVVSSSWTDTEHQEVSANTTDAPEYNASASLQEVENTALDINDPTLLSWDSYVILDRECPTVRVE
jgi:LysM repeat protein